MIQEHNTLCIWCKPCNVESLPVCTAEVRTIGQQVLMFNFGHHPQVTERRPRRIANGRDATDAFLDVSRKLISDILYSCDGHSWYHAYGSLKDAIAPENVGLQKMQVLMQL